MARSTTARLDDLEPASASPARSAAAEVRAWLPDLAQVAAIFTFLYVLLFFQGYTRLFRDSDAGWHIRSGEEISRSWQVPRADPYSFSRAGQPWINWEWLADLAAGVIHRAAGLGGVAVWYAAAIALTVWYWFRLHWKVGTNFLLACALAVPLLGTIHLHWLARPHIWSWVLVLAAIAWAESPPSRWRLALYALLSTLWANVHPSFVLAPVVALLYAASRWARPWIWNLDPGEEHAAARYYAVAAALSAVATLANPYGWHLHRHVVSYLADSELLASVAEFQSFNFHVSGAGQILAALLLAAAGTALALWRRRLDHFLLGVALLTLALQSARGLPLVALVLLPVAGAHLSELWRHLGDVHTLAPPLHKWLSRSQNYSDRLRALDTRAGGWIWAAPAALVLLLAAAPSFAGRAAFPSSDFPVAAAAKLENLAPQLFTGEGRLLAPDKYGGYLIYRFRGRLKVFFDGRSDFYGREFMRDYKQMVQVRPGWQSLVERHRFTHALLPSDGALADAMVRSGWLVVYKDATSTLLKGRSEGN